MKIIRNSSLILVQASDGSPFITTATVMLFYIMFNVLEALIETLIFGNRFEHWLDPIFVCIFIAYACYTVCMCAAYNTYINKSTNSKDEQP